MSATVHNAPLQRWRRQHHVTQAQLATDMGVHPSVVSLWENGHSVPSLKKFHELHRHTGISVHALLHFFVPLPPVQAGSGVVVQFSR